MTTHTLQSGDITQQIGNSDRGLRGLKSQLNDVETKIDKKRDKIAALDAAEEAQRNAIEAARQELAAIERTLGELSITGAVTRNTSSERGTEEAIAERETQRAQLQESIGAGIIQLNELQATNEPLRKNHAGDLAFHENERTALQAQYDELSKQRAALQSKLGNAIFIETEERIASLKKAIRDTQTDTARLEAELHQATYSLKSVLAPWPGLQRQAEEQFQTWKKDDAVTSLLKAHQGWLSAIEHYGAAMPTKLDNKIMADYLSFNGQQMQGLLTMPGGERITWFRQARERDEALIEVYSRGVNWHR